MFTYHDVLSITLIVSDIDRSNNDIVGKLELINYYQ